MSLISQNKVKIEGGMSSMTDLVFLLLIFFIILSALAKNAVDVDLPQGGGPGQSKPTLASIVVKPDNTVLLNNKVVEMKFLKNELLSALKDDPDKVVELYGDQSSNLGTTVEIIDIAQKNKLKIVIMTKK